jgi:hypothetical protein
MISFREIDEVTFELLAKKGLYWSKNSSLLIITAHCSGLSFSCFVAECAKILAGQRC